MKPVVVIAFYVWLALTVAIVLGRLARWTAARQASKRRRQARALARQQAEAMAVATPGAPITSSGPLAADPAPVPEPAPEPKPEPESDAQIEERRARERRAADRRVGDRRAGDRRATQPVAVETEPAPQPGPTIPQLLAGIAMPTDLMPIVADGAAASDQSAALISRERPAYEVGSGIADELERLGYELTPVGEAALLATRGNDILTVEIDPTPNQADPNGKIRFPNAGPNDVIVEFWVGSGPRPT